MADEEKVEEQVGFLSGIYQEIVNSPLNIALIAIITFLIFKIFKSRQPPKPSAPSEPELPKLRRDFTVAELKSFDGNQPDGRVLVAVNGTVYDVSRGKRFYGPGKAPLELHLISLFSRFQLTWCSLIPTQSSSPHFILLSLRVLLLDDETSNCDTCSTFHIPVLRIVSGVDFDSRDLLWCMRMQLATFLCIGPRTVRSGKNIILSCNGNDHSLLCNV